MFYNIVDGTCTVMNDNKNQDIYHVELHDNHVDSGTLLNSVVTLFWL